MKKLILLSALALGSFYAGRYSETKAPYFVTHTNHEWILQTPSGAFPIYEHGVGTIEQRMQSLLEEDVSELRRTLRKIQASNPTSSTDSFF